MSISAEEQKDLDKLQADRLRMQASFSDYLIHFLGLTEQELSHTGYKTKEEAIFKSTENHKKELDKLIKAHVKKWPDK